MTFSNSESEMPWIDIASVSVCTGSSIWSTVTPSGLNTWSGVPASAAGAGAPSRG